MKHTFKTLIVGLGFLSLVGCQQVSPAKSEPFQSEAPTGNDLSCPGSDNLNCFIDFPTGNQNFSDINFSVSYNSCMSSCLGSSGCSTTDVDAAADTCPAQSASCNEQCSLTSSQSPFANLPSSDGLTLPQNPKAVLVEVTSCLDRGVENELHVQGPDVRIVTLIDGNKSVYSTGFLGLGGKKARLGNGAGRNNGCPTDLKNRVKIKYTPIGEGTVALGSHSITVVPFTTTTAIEKVRALPFTMSSGLPAAIREELDLSEVVAVPKKFDVATPGFSPIMDWRYYNNDVAYGETVMFMSFYLNLSTLPSLFPGVMPGIAIGNMSGKPVVQTASFYMFAKSKDQ